MDKDERRRKGAHYTTEPNIMKVIGPLFLDEFRAELDRLKARRDGGKRAALLAFQEKLGRLQFLDPACGCGNFLVDRKSTRLNSVTNAHLVCRLLLEKKKKEK